ncbi:MAG: prolipoprotein diacylglyceryl transferase [Armatimonadota bacterium]|jgi:phosphatidylglycerol:prolipoprotein diacylglycerol transferase
MYSKLFSIGPVTIHAYGVMLTVGFVAGILWMRREGRHKGIGTDVVLDVALWTLLSSVLCARALFVALNWPEFAGSPRDIVWLSRGGLSFHGGVLGAIGAGSIFAVRRKIPFGTLSDIAAPAIPLGYALTRIGCFMNGCCQGFPTDLPWRYPQAPTTDAYGVLIQPSHPTQIYDSLMSLAVFGVILLLKPHFRARGQLFAAYVAIYSLERYIIEFWRAGYSAVPFAPLAPLTQAQVASVAIAVIAAAFLLVDEWARLNRAVEPPVDEPPDVEAEEPEAPSKPKKVHR